MTQDPRSRHDWMRDVLDEVLPLDNPLQVLWWGRYADQVCRLALLIWEKAHGAKFHAIPADTTPEMYAFRAMKHGMSLLLGSEIVLASTPELEDIRHVFLATQDRELSPVELIGFIIGALDAFSWRDSDDPDVARATQESFFLTCLLHPDDRDGVYRLLGGGSSD